MDVLGPVDGQVDRAGLAVVPAPLFDRVADGRVVDHGQQLGEVVGEQPEEQHLVAVVQLVQVDVALQVGGEPAQLEVRAVRLLVQGLHRGREPAGQAEACPLVEGERGPPVGQGVGDDGRCVHGVLLRQGGEPDRAGLRSSEVADAAHSAAITRVNAIAATTVLVAVLIREKPMLGRTNAA